MFELSIFLGGLILVLLTHRLGPTSRAQTGLFDSPRTRNGNDPSLPDDDYGVFSQDYYDPYLDPWDHGPND